MKIRSLILVLALAAPLIQCQTKKHSFDNPLDPEGENYQVPATPVLTFSDSVAVSDSTYTLTWTKADRALDYVIEESLKTNFSGTTTATASDTSAQFKHTVIKQSVRYYYRVKGRNGEYGGKWSNTVTISVSPNTYTLTGTITGADGVTVTLNGDASGAQTVNSGGRYSFSVIGGGSYTVTPTKTGYNFSPANKAFTSVTADGTQDFNGTKLTFTISGKITGEDGVSVTLSGDKSETQIVNSGGTYSFSVEYGGNYTVTLSKTGYNFTPSNKVFQNVTANRTQDFTTTFTLSGKVTGADGVMVTLSGDKSETQTVNSGGSYSFIVPYGGSYTVTPSKSGYVFTPAARTFTNVTADQELNFTAQAQAIPATDVKMVSIFAGTFSMGQSGIAEPVHTVTLSAFEMSVYEITQGQYKSVIGTNPSYFTGDDNLPVEQVSWWDAIKFCNALSVKAGFEKCYNESTGDCDFTKNGFRLPTEAEWEYACRAGSMTTYNLGDAESDLARAGWYSGNSESKTHPVGQKTPNAWGLYDMHGNVWEWCQDWYNYYASGSATNPTGAYNGTARVGRGGGWYASALSLYRSVDRDSCSPDYKGWGQGFRVVRRASSQSY